MTVRSSRMLLVVFHWYSALHALAQCLRGVRPRQASYVATAGKRRRRPLLRLAASFPQDAPQIERGEFRGALLVYAATIGELHPMLPVVENYLRLSPSTPVVLLAGQMQYLDAFRMAVPGAAVGILPPGAPWLYDRLFRRVSPCAVIIGEGPCLNLRFPIPFELALPAACLRFGVPLVVANSTMFPEQHTSLADRMTHRLFGQLHSDAIKCWYAPNRIFRDWLLEAGIPQARIVVTGDLRFDALRPLGAPSTELRELLTHLRNSGQPIIVAGSVNAIDEQSPVVDAWSAVRSKYLGARLILAPRHINNTENMAKLCTYLDRQGYAYSRRSEGLEKAKGAQVLIVDVFGELPHFYSVASVAYIGRNHTLLEPLRFRVPTVVAPRSDWTPRYVTFPAYLRLADGNAIAEATDKRRLGEIFLRLVEQPAVGARLVENAMAIALSEQGAGERIARHITTFQRRA